MDLVKTILSHPKLESLRSGLSDGKSLIIEELSLSTKALLLTIAAEVTGKSIVFISGCEKILSDAPFFNLHLQEFPAWETLPSEEIAPSADRVGERYHILHDLALASTPSFLYCSLQAALQKVLPKKQLLGLCLALKVGESLPFELIPSTFIEMGYERKAVASDKGEFAVRGGIIDIFPVDSPDPFRIEFLEDEIGSIRKYDPIGQTSVGKVDHIMITPGKEYELISKNQHLETLLDYLGPNTLIILDNLVALEDKYAQIKGMLSKKVQSFLAFEELLEKLTPLQTVLLVEQPLEALTEVRRDTKATQSYGSRVDLDPVTFTFFEKNFSLFRWHAPFFDLHEACSDAVSVDSTPAEWLDCLEKAGTPLHLICQSQAEIESFEQKWPNAHFYKGYLSSGWVLLEPSIAIVPTVELTGKVSIRRQKQRSHYTTHASTFMAITPGEAIVHMNSGIGRYLGIERRPNHLGQDTEYMLVEYAEGAKLYVPMDQAHLVSKYIGAGESKPELNTLGSSKWKRAREKSEQAILGYAKDLLELQAQRVAKGGFVYPTHSSLIHQFEDEFPYEETPDQKLAIQSIYDDMQSSLAMDRLICGDVGYGKTEVAMRAAFKAVVDGGKQVAVLVPTTVLAMQHYESFKLRMQNFPIKLGIVSRFQKPKEIKKTLEQVAAGEIDILVGTHRIVGADVIFKDLGLVIIDEEQRFGVKVKEHLKKLRHEVDCLTLSATPIPRTLYMSLVGARQLSCINTPPEDRLPIQTLVCQKNEEVIKNALLRELARDGQAFIIHNRVESLFEFADNIRKLLPAARLGIGHGQMSGDDLDHVFHEFKTGKTDILIATSIIENGIDIPNANTILIDQSDRFGMAELYQMRGRVGRWNRKAYCYFLVSNLTYLNEIARKRLMALASASGQGGGMKIAMHDLEIRGAGNILGTEQSGHVQAIGFHFYCKLLKKAVTALQKSQKPLLFSDVKIEFPFDARLPDDYVNDVTLRMEIYQRLGDCDSYQEMDELISETIDRFGPAPDCVAYLLAFAKIRLFAQQHAFSLIKIGVATLHAEQDHGKKGKITKKMMLKLPKDPLLIVKVITETLSNQFFLNTTSVQTPLPT
jgi:transcription-repair coupling factor (superfamily II helicase)